MRAPTSTWIIFVTASSTWTIIFVTASSPSVPNVLSPLAHPSRNKSRLGLVSELAFHAYHAGHPPAQMFFRMSLS